MFCTASQLVLEDFCINVSNDVSADMKKKQKGKKKKQQEEEEQTAEEEEEREKQKVSFHQ